METSHSHASTHDENYQVLCTQRCPKSFRSELRSTTQRQPQFRRLGREGPMFRRLSVPAAAVSFMASSTTETEKKHQLRKSKQSSADCAPTHPRTLSPVMTIPDLPLPLGPGRRNTAAPIYCRSPAGRYIHRARRLN